MKYFFKIILILLLVVSCSTNDDNTDQNDCTLINYKAAQLYYDYFDRQSLGLRTGFASDFTGITLQYNNQGKITNVNGGPILVATGPNLSEWYLSNLIDYSISYSGNNITVTSAIESFNGDTTNDYTIENSEILNRSIIIPQGILNEKVIFTYQYEVNSVKEFKGQDLFRTFYFENDNLIKIEEFIYYDINNPLEETDIIYGKYETLFSEFDSLPNLLEGKFFLDGAFFKSFSKNNYHKVELDYYIYNQDTQEFVPESVDGNFRSYNFGINEDGSSGLFITDCI